MDRALVTYELAAPQKMLFSDGALMIRNATCNSTPSREWYNIPEELINFRRRNN
jgi:hypothetical protein